MKVTFISYAKLGATIVLDLKEETAVTLGCHCS